MDLKLLENIVAIADYENISKAAEALFITQSGLNQQLIKLENDLGTPLFYRTKRHLHPTEAGRIYLESAREILKIKRCAYTRIQDLADSTIGEIHFGLSFEHGVEMFISISPAFNQKYPGVRVHLAEQKVSKQLDMIRSGQLDMAFVMLHEHDKNENQYIPLCREELVLGCPIHHPLAAYAAPPGQPLTTLPLSLFKNEKFAFMFPGSTMRSVIDPLFFKSGFQPDILFETTMNFALAQLVSNGLCCTILPQSYARDTTNTAWFRLEDEPSWMWEITHSKNMVLSEASWYLIELSKQYAACMKKHWEAHQLGIPDRPLKLK